MTDQSFTLSRASALKGLVAFLFIALLVFLGLYRLQPPAALPADAPVAEFSAGRALQHLKAFAQRPHPPGTSEHDRVQEYIVSAFTALGLNPEVQATSPLYVWDFGLRTIVDTGEARNILVRMKGIASTRAILIAGHYDSVVSSPNASDGGSAVAVALELARLLQAGPPLKNDVIFLMTDVEEHSLLGARGFVEQHPWAKEIGLVLHFVARGSSGPSIMFETSLGNQWLIEEFAKSAPHPIANSLADEIYRLLPNDTDFRRYREFGLAGFNFSYIDDAAHYHTMLDNPENVDQRSLQHDGAYALALTRHFGNLDLTQVKRDGQAVYFDVWGLTLLHYPQTWVIPLALLLSVGYVGIVIWGRKRGYWTFSGIRLGIVVLLLTMVIVFVLVLVLGYVLPLLHPEYRLLFPGNLYNSHFYLVSFAFLTVAVASLLYHWARKKASWLSLTVGSLFVWLLLTVATAFFMPGASYLFMWPLVFMLLAVGLMCLTRPQTDSPALSWLSLSVFSLGVIPGLMLLVPTIYLLYTALPPLTGGWLATGSWLITGGLVMSVLLVLLLSLLVPHLTVLAQPSAKLLPSSAALIGIAFLVAGSLTASFNSERPRPNTLLYGFNADTGQAVWLNTDPQLDEWTAQFFPVGTQRADARDWSLLGLGRSFFMGPAPRVPVPSPSVEVLDNRVQDGISKVRLRVVLPQRTRMMIAYFPVEPGTLLKAQVNNVDIQVGPKNESVTIRKWGDYPPTTVGLELYVESTSSQPLKLTLFSGFDGFPQTAQLSFTPRPAGMIPAHRAMASEGQEAVMVRQTFEFPVTQVSK